MQHDCLRVRTPRTCAMPFCTNDLARPRSVPVRWAMGTPAISESHSAPAGPGCGNDREHGKPRLLSDLPVFPLFPLVFGASVDALGVTR
jgi:hypothetical protein